MDEKSILTECYVDTSFIETIIPTQSGYNHQMGCSNVSKVMRTKFVDRFALGIIDKDKNDIDYLKEFSLVDEVENEVFLWKHKEKHHFVIQIKPEIEPWLLKISEELGIEIQDYNLPKNLKDFYKVTKRITSKYDKRLIGLFKEINRKKEENNKLRQISQWINILKAKTYNVTIEELSKK